MSDICKDSLAEIITDSYQRKEKEKIIFEWTRQWIESMSPDEIKDLAEQHNYNTLIE